METYFPKRCLPYILGHYAPSRPDLHTLYPFVFFAEECYPVLDIRVLVRNVEDVTSVTRGYKGNNY